VRRALAIAVLAACTERGGSRSEPTPEPAMPQASRPERAADGTEVCILQARVTKDVVAPFKSIVAELMVKLNDGVARGQAVARLDERPLKEELALARAGLRARHAEVAQAEVAQRAAQAKLNRERAALDRGIVALAQVEEADFELRKAVAAVRAAGAAAGEQQARIAISEARLADTTLHAPEGGRVAILYRQPGEPVPEGAPVLRIISNDELFVRLASPPERRLAEGDAIELTLDDTVRATAIVRRVAPSIDPVAHVVFAEAELQDPPPGLNSGMPCRFAPRR
jgi:HlyD family secretion protein